MKKMSIVILFLSIVSSMQLDCRFILADVSMKDVFNDCHITGAKNFPFDKILRYTRKFDKDSEIVFYCTNYRCISGREACKLFKSKGFKNVAVYEGGVAEWYQLNKEGKDFPFEGPGKMGFLSQKMDRVETDDHDVKVIDAQQLKEKLETYVYSRNTMDSIVDKFSDIFGSIRSFFYNLFGLN